MSPGTACISCSIAAGEAEASIVHLDDLETAFVDLMPLTPGHLPVVPNERPTSLADINDLVAGQMMVVGNRLAQAIRHSEVAGRVIDHLLADGQAAGQVVFDGHIRVGPQFAGDGIALHVVGEAFAAWHEIDPSRGPRFPPSGWGNRLG
ncbi:MAG: HIT domain-containing protein [Anaerolineae bacterium]|nr:HIT domain-containing protein [Anaerolineae bacterium]NIN96124.1 HIT domain-containing protein [Anaerolineae bacterium]